MLDMGFIRDIRKILAILPPKRQNLLFSATFSDEIRRLADGLLDNPASVQVTPRNTPTELVTQVVHMVDRERKRELLSHLITTGRIDQALVFTRTKHGANRLALQLEKDGIAATAIHGNKSQPQRVRALADFKAGRFAVLVATEVAARGLDIEALPHVVNFELPMVPEDYVHRIGRTGRAGVDGDAVSLVCVDELKLLNDIERVLGRGIPRETIAGFEPDPRDPTRADPSGWARRRPAVPVDVRAGCTAPRRVAARRGTATRWRTDPCRRVSTERWGPASRRRPASRRGPGRRRRPTTEWRAATRRSASTQGPSWRRLRRSAATGSGDRQRRRAAAGSARTASRRRPGSSEPWPGHRPAGRAPGAPGWPTRLIASLRVIRAPGRGDDGRQAPPGAAAASRAGMRKAAASAATTDAAMPTPIAAGIDTVTRIPAITAPTGKPR